MKIFEYNKKVWNKCRYQYNYQFFIIKNISLFHIIFDVDDPCPYTGIRILFSILSGYFLFGVDFDFKSYFLSFCFISRYVERNEE